MSKNFEEFSTLINGTQSVGTGKSNDLTGFTAKLIATSDLRCKELIAEAKNDPTIGTKIMECLKSGEAVDIFQLIEGSVIQQITTDATECLTGATDKQLARMLESRRSERSTAKKTQFKNLKNVTDYISASYAELVIRQASGKAYAATSGIDLSDGSADAINRRIASLRSKQSRMKPLAKFSPEAQKDLEAVQAEIAQLQQKLGVTAKATTQTRAELLSDLMKIDLTSLPPEVAARLQAIIDKQ